jgi:catechol 2,3-dioxygenase-like lactoylglutathione lyase family enzyme
MATVTIDELSVADDPARWRGLGFDVDGDACDLAGVRVRLLGAGAGRGILGWSLRDVPSTELDGLPTALSREPVRPPALPHANGALGIDHVVAMTPAFERTVAALRAAGLDLRRVREEPTPAGAPRQAFFRLGREILELVQEPAEVVAERSGGADGPARFWGLALLVDDLDETISQLGEQVSPARAAVQEGRRIATVRRSAGLAIPLALMSRDERTVPAA